MAFSYCPQCRSYFNAMRCPHCGSFDLENDEFEELESRQIRGKNLELKINKNAILDGKENVSKKNKNSKSRRHREKVAKKRK